MYTLHKVLTLSPSVTNKWVEMEDLAGFKATNVESIRAIYGEVQLQLTHNTDPDNKLRYAFTNNYKEFRHNEQNPTFERWLDLAHDFNLSTVAYRNPSVGHALYCDAIEGDFRVSTSIPFALPSPRHMDQAREDVFVGVPERLTVDVVHDNCLFTVAGLLHRPHANANGIWLKGGGKTLNRSGINTCGVISFARLGGVSTHDIDPANISGLPEEGERRMKLVQPLFIKVPEFDPARHTLMLSFMGTLIPLGKTLKLVGDNVFELNLVQYDYVAQWMRVERLLDMSDAKSVIEHYPNARTKFSNYDMCRPEFLRKILTADQSFVILINNPRVFIDKVPLETTQNSMAFMTMLKVDSPVVDRNGIMMDYLLSTDLEYTVLDVPPSDLMNRRMMRTSRDVQPAIDSQADSMDQMSRNTATMLKITGQAY